MLDPVTDKFTESVYVLANEPSVALYRLQEHVRRSLPELAQHKVSRGCRGRTEAGTPARRHVVGRSGAAWSALVTAA
jgi:hypothetical protein